MFMKKRFASQSVFFSPRALIALLLCAGAGGISLAFFRLEAAVSNNTLTFAERVAYQRAIEEVYWRHRIWPKENPQPKPPLDAVASPAQLEQKVEAYLRKSQFAAERRGSPIIASELQAEMDRMASHTKRPDVLRELFAALGNDPFVIAECLVRPIVAERLVADPMTDAKETSFRAKSRTPAAWLMGDSTGSFDFARDDMAANLDKRGYKLPDISLAADCTDDTWTATSALNAPDARSDHTLVWTGSEMIIWGGAFTDNEWHFFNTGGRYDPATDSWTPTSTTNAPFARWLHTAVWTGSEMIVWGGSQNTIPNIPGGRYNPTTDTWAPTSTTNAPTGRVHHTAVWTGAEMIVWGGYGWCGGSCRSNSGGRYDPNTDAWTATSTLNAPEARWLHNAEWTGSEMIVWGGTNETIYLNTGGRYNPNTDSWTATGVPNDVLGRIAHAAVWTGSEMIVWGGVDSTFNDCNTGGRYNPTADSWSATSTANEPQSRDSLAAVWTGSEMIVWGGIFCCPVIDFNTGGRYNLASDSWTSTTTVNAPFPRYSLQAHNFAVWTGSETIVWGGYNYEYKLFFNTGGRYCAQSGPTPTPTPTPAGITLSAAGRKVGGINTVRLTWSGATSANIDVYRNRALVVTTANDGSYTDSTGDTGRARYTYQICAAGTQTCSNTVRVSFRQ
jgi:lambda repressor-like predicted transcriptional regulator